MTAVELVYLLGGFIVGLFVASIGDSWIIRKSKRDVLELGVVVFDLSQQNIALLARLRERDDGEHWKDA